MALALYGTGPLRLCPFKALALYGPGPLWLWSFMAPFLGSQQSHFTSLKVRSINSTVTCSSNDFLLQDDRPSFYWTFILSCDAEAWMNGHLHGCTHKVTPPASIWLLQFEDMASLSHASRTWTHSDAQARFEFETFLSQPPKQLILQDCATSPSILNIFVLLFIIK